jgi:hypothetical protein
MRLVLTRLWTDSDGMLQVEFFVDGSGFAATQDAYVYPADLQAFGRKLQSFPSKVTDEVILEIGSTDSNFQRNRSDPLPLLQGLF